MDTKILNHDASKYDASQLEFQDYSDDGTQSKTQTDEAAVDSYQQATTVRPVKLTLTPFLNLLMLAGCSPEEPVYEIDPDGDGVLPPEDCDDHNNQIKPGSNEFCNGIDDDCDGDKDEDAVDIKVWYKDADNDGFGDPNVTVEACEQPEGFLPIQSDQDCDDEDRALSPDVIEICDGVDNNCNDATDEGFITTWYFDGDDDGFGDPEMDTYSCSEPLQYVSNNRDCDDDDGSVNPDTIWYNDVDLDGYGNPDDFVRACEAPLGFIQEGSDCNDINASISPETIWFADEDGDTYGNSWKIEQQCVPTVSSVYENNLDCNDDDNNILPSATESIGDGVDDDCDISLSDTQWHGVALGERAGESLALVENIDGASSVGIAVAAPLGILNGYQTGIIYVSESTLLGGDLGTVNMMFGEEQNGLNDSQLVSGGDIEDNNTGNLIISDPHFNGDLGKVYVLDGLPLFSPFPLASLLSIEGTVSNAQFGERLLGNIDVNGDGYSDFLVGAPNIDSAYLFTGPVNATTDIEAQIHFQSLNPGSRLGDAFAADDLDGNGMDDLFIGQSVMTIGGYVNNGRILYYQSPLSEGVLTDGFSSRTGSVYGSSDNMNLGSHLLSGGDLDGDGMTDVVAGLPGDATNGINAGKVIVISGVTFTDFLDKILDPSMISFSVLGRDSDDQVGSTLIVSDLNGDGNVDLIVGGKQFGSNGFQTGMLCGFFGPLSGTVDLSAEQCDFLTPASINSELGISADGGKDINGDGKDDIIVGAPGVLSGNVEVFLGSDI